MSAVHDRIQRIRKNNRLGADDLIGLRGTFGHEVKIQGDGRTVDVVANTDDVDLADEVVIPSGADTTYFFKNGAVFSDHYTDTEHTVGIRRRTRPWPNNADHRAWRVEVYVRDTPLGNDILEMVRAGCMGVSIGFISVDQGRPDKEEAAKYGPQVASVVRRWKWLELSFTAFPCNVSCRAAMAESPMMVDDRKAGILEGLLVKGLVRPTSAAAVGFPIKSGRTIICRR